MLADFVRETSTTTGTGALSLGGAASSDFRTFVAALGDGSQCRYSIRNPGTGEWETGIGTITAGTPDTLSRDTVEASSNAGALVNFTAGTKDVTVSATANALLTDMTKDAGTISTGTLTLDVGSYGTFTWTVGGAHTVAFGTWPATGTAYRSLIITNGGSAAITWPASIVWAGGVEPTLQAAGTDRVDLWHVSGTVYGYHIGVGAVSSVNGKSGAVTLSAADVGAAPTTRTVSAGSGLTGGGDLSADRTLSLTGQAAALHSLSSNGIIVRTGSGVVASRTLQAGSGISISNPDGVAGNPVISAASSGGDLVKISEMTPNYVNYFQFSVPSGYRGIVVVIDNVLVNCNYLRTTYSTNGGSTFVNNGSSTYHTFKGASSEGGNDLSGFVIGHNSVDTAFDMNGYVSGHVTFHLTSTNTTPSTWSKMRAEFAVSYESSARNHVYGFGGGFAADTYPDTVTHIRIATNTSSNMSEGRFILYGIK